jgi:hypothetical protein
MEPEAIASGSISLGVNGTVAQLKLCYRAGHCL